jgi:hypothetical protein
VFNKVLVALNRPKDLTAIVSFLRGRNEKPFLVLLSLKPSKLLEESLVVTYEARGEDSASLAKDLLQGFEFEEIELGHNAAELPATLISREAEKRKCDAVVALSDGDKGGTFAVDLASTLVLESRLPLLVVRN